jgi:micrococcal nuclease
MTRTASLVSFMALFTLLTQPVHSRPTAIDGDTVRMDDGRTIRAANYDTPETFKPHCKAERALGYQAAGRLQGLLNRRPLGLKTYTRKDKYGRTLAELFIGSQDVAQILIREGLAVAYSGGRRTHWAQTLCGLKGIPGLPALW